MTAATKPKLGRPKNPGNDGLVTGIHVRLSAEQREMFQAWAEIMGLTMSGYIRRELSLLCDKNSKKTEARKRRSSKKCEMSAT